jgi:phenylacetate-CoA ligase
LICPIVFNYLGLDFFGRLEWLNGTMHWSKENRAIWRLKRLGDILEFCWEHVPFYREFWGDHGVSVERPCSFEDLEAYPILTKDLIKCNWERIKSDILRSIPHKLNSTGGTTGSPLKYYQDLRVWAFNQAFNLWGWGQAGYSFGDPVGVIAGYSLIPRSLKLSDRFRYLLERKLTLSGVHMDKALAMEYHRKLNIFEARYLYGYPSAISLFASYLKQEGLRLPHVRAIITTAEMLQPHYKKNIEETLGCPVWDHYGCNDGGIMSYECSLHKGYHYNDLLVIVEIHQKNPNGSGRLLITNLWNRSMPFIRYENGDSVSLSRYPCPCGQPFPLIKSVEGRTADILTFSNGRNLSGPALTLIFRDMEIDGWQVVQRAKNMIEISILSSGGIKQEEYNYIRKVFETHVGENVKVKVSSVSELKATASGKLKPVWIDYTQ